MSRKTCNSRNTRTTGISKRETERTDRMPDKCSQHKKYASYLQTLLAVKEMEKEVETQDRCLQSLLNRQN